MNDARKNIKTLCFHKRPCFHSRRKLPVPSKKHCSSFLSANSSLTSTSGSVCSCYTNHSIRPSRKRTCLSLQNQGYSEATHHCSEATQHCWVLSKHLAFATHVFYKYILLLYVQKPCTVANFGGHLHIQLLHMGLWPTGKKLLVQHLFLTLWEDEKPKSRISPNSSLVRSTSCLSSKCLLTVCSLTRWRDWRILSPSLYKGPDSRMGAPTPWLCLLVSWEYHFTGS